VSPLKSASRTAPEDAGSSGNGFFFDRFAQERHQDEYPEAQPLEEVLHGVFATPPGDMTCNKGFDQVGEGETDQQVLLPAALFHLNSFQLTACGQPV